MQHVRRFCLFLVPVALVALVITLLTGQIEPAKIAGVTAALALALGLGSVPALRTFSFTAWIIAAVTAAMLYPQAFQSIGGVSLREKWIILLVVQVVMFGMGTQMALHDFVEVAKAPRGVLVGILCHFSVMPLIGFGLTKVFHFDPDIAAGIILIGSCSSGLASNVMAYIAKANLGLSVAVTAITTMIAPFMTPLLMKWLAGNAVTLSFLEMMIEIIKTVIVPIAAALLHDYLKTASPKGIRTVGILSSIAGAWLGLLAGGGWDFLASRLSHGALLSIELFSYLLASVVVGQIYHFFVRRLPSIPKWMPVFSMAGIVYFTTVTTAAGRNNLLAVGPLLFLASVLHNALGYFFGYVLSRAAGLDVNSARSVAFEVGLQNGGMATSLANSMGKIATMGLAPAIFSPWMNVSGSLLANYWRRRPVPRSPGTLPEDADKASLEASQKN
jgi:BASS family bile acid:Na+ symporter